jgi:cullin 3
MISPRFRPDLGMLKKTIESLIEREYLERIEGADRPTYRYLA